MTERYTIFSETGDDIADMFDDEIKIDGVAETFYFHVIYHKKHEKYAKMIADGHHEDLDKPE